MTALQRIFLVSTVVLIPVLVTGLVRRRYLRLSYFFSVYLVAVWLGDASWLLFPSRFYNWSFYMVKETTYSLLYFGLALELSWLVFGGFPGAAATSRRIIFTLLAVIFAALVAGPIEKPGMKELVIELQPRLVNGSAFLLLAVWALIFWYHVPVHRMHRVILRGLVPYLLVFTVAMRLIATLGWDVRQAAGYLDAVAYITLVVYWSWETWRRVEEAAVPAAIEPYLGWRARLRGGPRG